MLTEKKYLRAYRARRVYGASLIVAASYLFYFLLSRVFGQKYWRRKLKGLHQKNAYRLRKVFTELGGLFIKIGQFASILSSFLPEEFRKPLEGFQDKVPPRPYEEVRGRIIEELGRTPEELFSHFEKEPIASASIGQVHKAKLKSGEEVVVKIQHVHIEAVSGTDLELFERVLNWVAWFFKMKGLNHIAAETRKMISQELDYLNEKQNMIKIGENLQKLDFVRVPEVLEDFCTSKIITSRFYEGCKITDIPQLEHWDLNRETLARQLVEMCCHMALVDGLYHADPHPGNILVSQEGTFILVDFGAVAQLHPKMKEGLSRLLEAGMKADTEEIVSSLQFMGFVGKNQQATKYAEKVLVFVQDFFQNEVKMESFNFEDMEFDLQLSTFSRIMNLFSIREMSNAFEIPKDYILLNRMVLLASGVSAELAPKLNPLLVVQPYLQEFVLGSGKDLPKLLFDFLRKNLTNLLTLPVEMRKVLTKARKGELEIRIPEFQNQTKLIYYLGQELIIAILLISSIGATYFFNENGETLLRNWGIGVSIVLLLFLIRMIRKATRIL